MCGSREINATVKLCCFMMRKRLKSAKEKFGKISYHTFNIEHDLIEWRSASKGNFLVCNLWQDNKNARPAIVRMSGKRGTKGDGESRERLFRPHFFLAVLPPIDRWPVLTSLPCLISPLTQYLFTTILSDMCFRHYKSWHFDWNVKKWSIGQLYVNFSFQF